MRTVTINGAVVWSAKKNQKTGAIVADCEALRLSMAGDNEEDLEANIRETLQMFFSSLLQSGEFDTFLRTRGWTHTNIPSAHEVSPDELEFDVPYELIMRKRVDGSSRACH